MRSMTEEQAKLYIKAGYFPKENEIEAICDLQDCFGHLPYKFVINLLADEDYVVNAEKLYRLIWNEETVDRYMEYVSDYYNNIRESISVQYEIVELQKKLDELTRKISAFEYISIEE